MPPQRVLLAALSVPGFPLFVASGRSREAVLAPWRDEAWQIFDRTLLTSAAMLALIALAAWGFPGRLLQMKPGSAPLCASGDSDPV